MRRTILLGFVIQVLFATAPTQAGDWPGWRGPTGMGITDEKDLPLTWGGKDNDDVLWKTPLPGTDSKSKVDHNQSSPIVWKGRVFIIMVYWPEGMTQSEFPEHHIACYSTADGKRLWDTKVQPGPWQLKDLRGGYSAPTPCTDGERVYALFGSSVLVALDFDGKLVWRKEVTPYAWDVAIGTSPCLYKDTVLVLADGTAPQHSRLIAFDKQTGEIKWEQKRPTYGFSHSSPILVEVKGKPQLLVSASNALQGLDPGDGKVLWWASHKGDVPTPVMGGGLVYAHDGRGGAGMAVEPTGEGDVSKTLVKWRTGPIPEGFSSPVIAGDYIYVVHNPGIIKCLKLSSGETVYSERLPAGVSAEASLILTPENRIYLAGAGKSIIIAAGPKLEILATNDLNDRGSASPAIAGGRIYLKGSRNLYCVGKK